MINVSIIGANGYTGLELMKILPNHKHVELKHLVSRSNAGTKITDMYPNLVALENRLFEDVNIDEIAKDSDVVFCCLPHAASSEICAKFYHKNVRVIDLSADFRYKNYETYKQWYKVEHFEPKLLDESVYGLCEINKNEIKNAKIIGNPGCYTTCSILPLYPLLHEKVIKQSGIIIDAKSGTSGAGKKADTGNLFCEVNENFKAYGVTTHRHMSEIEEQLSIASKSDINLIFTPHLLPIQRGILSTIYCSLESNSAAEDIMKAYNKFYANSKFVKVLSEGVLPEIKHVSNSNYCFIGFKIDKKTNSLITISVLDNLVKGASGQAVQNMNIMFGLEETCGLEEFGRYL